MVNMKNRIFTTSVREIKSSFKRFLSLLVMSLLGVGVFVGIQATEPDMINSLDTYYDNNNVYDIKLISTLGLTKDDVNAIKKINNTSDVEGSYSKDILIKTDNAQYVVKALGITEKINNVKLIKGKMPTKENEILVEDGLLKHQNLKIGDSIIIEDNTFNETNLKIVGTVKSPLYITNSGSTASKGNTNLGDGKISYYIYMNNSNFNLDYYTEIYVTTKNAKEKLTSKKDYTNLIKNNTLSLESIKDERQQKRYDEIYNKINSEIEKQEQEGNAKLNIAKNQLNSVKTKLSTGKKELDNANGVLSSTAFKLDETKKILDSSKKQLDAAKEQIDSAQASIKEKINSYGITEEVILELIEKYEEGTLSYADIIKYLPEDKYEEEIDKIKEYITNNNITITDIETLITEIINDPSKIEDYINSLTPEEINRINEEIENIIVKLKPQAEKIIELYNAKEEYNKGLALYNESLSKYEEGMQEYQKGLAIYKSNLREYNSSLYLYNSSLQEYNDNKVLLATSISEAKEELNKMDTAKWYIYNRTDMSSYNDFINDAQSIKNLSKIFPTVFYIIAILISLISMSRMVEDDRMQIGTLKSLGFSNKHILFKYIIYSGIATILGGIIGSLLGFFLLPNFIWSIYKIIFDIPVFKVYYDLTYILLGLLIAIICICGTTLLAVFKSVKEKPSNLMRPKSPKSGKRVLLENVKFIWKRLKFSNKVTIRNLFRYKKRVLMTVVGIAGCTALMLAGFGLRDSIVDIPDVHYGKVFTFDQLVYLESDIKEDNIKSIFNDKRINTVAETKMVTGNINTYGINIFVPKSNNDLYNILNLRDVKTNKKLILKDNEVIITDKLSQLLNKSKGDIITITANDGKTYDFKISGICENYVAHYVYMTKNTYEENMDKYITNVVYIKTNNLSLKEEAKLSSDLIEKEEVMSAISIKNTKVSVNDMLKSLNSVVLILIILSAILSFVVMYNLSYISISERKREIATLKVLGFTDKEVDNYINKETIILTIIGIVFGFVFGYFLTNIIINTVEIDLVRFIRLINPLSFIYSAVITIIFTIIVNIITHFTLKKIDMIESLKSVE